MAVDVCDFIVSGRPQPKEGTAVVYYNMVVPSGNATLAPPINKGYTINQFYTMYDNRLNHPRYYTGDTPD